MFERSTKNRKNKTNLKLMRIVGISIKKLSTNIQ
jgi:hypothetical protein